jgi:type II secretory pathway pseudopilin PulG
MKKILGFVTVASLAVLLLPVLIDPPDRSTRERDRAQATARAIVVAMEKYRREYSEWPAAGHAETIKALRGENPQAIVFLAVPDESVNARGELHDPWGTPYRISINAKARRADVLSAGPDRVFQTPGSRHNDDIRGLGAGGIPGLPF